MVALLPPTPMGVLFLVLTVVGTVAVVRMDVNKAYGLGLLVLGIFGLQMVNGLFLTGRLVPPGLAIQPAPFLEGSQWWAPLTHMYLHGGIGHIAGNLLILLTAGPALEDRIGPRRFLVIYFVAGFAGAASHVGLYLLNFLVTATSPAVGASGAIFGVLTAFAMVAPREKLPIPLYIIIWLPAYVVLLVFLGINLALIFTPGSNVAWWAHFAGFIVGLLASVWLERAPDPRGRFRAVDVTPLRELATTETQENVLERLDSIEGSTEDDRTWTQVWLDRFAERTPCPACGADVRHLGDRLVCAEGDWSMELEPRPEEE